MWLVASEEISVCESIHSIKYTVSSYGNVIHYNNWYTFYNKYKQYCVQIDCPRIINGEMVYTLTRPVHYLFLTDYIHMYPYDTRYMMCCNLIKMVRLMHIDKIYHGNLCPENILFKGVRPMIKDFTLDYYSIDSFKSDIFWLAKIIVHILSKQPFVKEKTIPEEVFSLQPKHILIRCLSMNPSLRPDIHVLHKEFSSESCGCVIN